MLAPPCPATFRYCPDGLIARIRPPLVAQRVPAPSKAMVPTPMGPISAPLGVQQNRVSVPDVSTRTVSYSPPT